MYYIFFEKTFVFLFYPLFHILSYSGIYLFWKLKNGRKLHFGFLLLTCLLWNSSFYLQCFDLHCNSKSLLWTDRSFKWKLFTKGSLFKSSLSSKTVCIWKQSLYKNNLYLKKAFSKIGFVWQQAVTKTCPCFKLTHGDSNTADPNIKQPF